MLCSVVPLLLGCSVARLLCCSVVRLLGCSVALLLGCSVGRLRCCSGFPRRSPRSGAPYSEQGQGTIELGHHTGGEPLDHTIHKVPLENIRVSHMTRAHSIQTLFALARGKLWARTNHWSRENYWPVGSVSSRIAISEAGAPPVPWSRTDTWGKGKQLCALNLHQSRLARAMGDHVCFVR